MTSAGEDVLDSADKTNQDYFTSYEDVEVTVRGVRKGGKEVGLRVVLDDYMFCYVVWVK